MEEAMSHLDLANLLQFEAMQSVDVSWYELTPDNERIDCVSL